MVELLPDDNEIEDIAFQLFVLNDEEAALLKASLTDYVLALVSKKMEEIAERYMSREQYL